MGAKGSFSEKAGELYKKEQQVADGVIVPLISAEAVLTAVENGEVEKRSISDREFQWRDRDRSGARHGKTSVCH